jgi:ribosomal protein S18 acetylase RimI-like enzyme
MDIMLRPIRDDDLPFLRRVYASTREEELAPVPWTRAEKDAFLGSQFALQHRYYQEHYSDADFRVILVGGVPVGRLYLARWEGEHRIVDIAVLPEHRGRGIGSRLLGEIVAEADAAGKPVSIHVEIQNRARRLYERLGFRPIEERGVYILMRRPVGGAARDPDR